MSNEVLEKWENWGFLYGIPEEQKSNLADRFESVAKYLVEYDEKSECESVENAEVSTVIFPIVRKLFCIQKNIEDILSNPDELAKIVKERFSKENKAKFIKDYCMENAENIDLQAELCADVCQQIFRKSFEK